VEKQREKIRGGITGKGFIKGDPRINRTKPGPGRPPLWWKHLLGRYEEDAVHLIGATIAEGRSRLRKKGEEGVQRVHLAAAQYVLDRSTASPHSRWTSCRRWTLAAYRTRSWRRLTTYSPEL
jgi:hypothetical protein